MEVGLLCESLLRKTRLLPNSAEVLSENFSVFRAGWHGSNGTTRLQT